MSRVTVNDGPWETLVVDVKGTIIDHMLDAPILNVVGWVNEQAISGVKVIVWTSFGAAAAKKYADKVGLFYDEAVDKGFETMRKYGEDPAAVFVDDENWLPEVFNWLPVWEIPSYD